MNSKELKKYVLDLISTFKEIGLYEKFKGQNAKEILSSLELYFLDEAKIKEYIENDDLGIELLKQRLCQETMLIDKLRCLTNHDTEWVYEEGDYIPFVTALCNISNGQLEPAQITEKWDTNRKITITISTPLKKVIISPKLRSDWADVMTILTTLNDNISNYAFYFVFDQEVIAFLNIKEKEALEKMGITLEEPRVKSP